MKNRDGADKHPNSILTWVAYVGGPRESRRLLGDVILTEEDIVSKRDFPDGCVPEILWSIDLHYPKKQYAKKFPDNHLLSPTRCTERVWIVLMATPFHTLLLLSPISKISSWRVVA